MNTISIELSSSLYSILKNVGLQQYYHAPQANGFEDWIDFLEITKQRLSALGFTRIVMGITSEIPLLGHDNTIQPRAADLFSLYSTLS